MPRRAKSPPKKDPIKQRPLSQPGDSAYDRLQSVLVEKVLLWVFSVAVFGVAALVQWSTWWTQTLAPPYAMTVIAVGVGVVAAFRIRTALREVRNLRLGIRGEMSVGQQLEGLRASGYKVYHDIQEDGYNIDHVVVGPGGVFVIETKTASKPPGQVAIDYDGERLLIAGKAPDRDPLKQARACRDRVAEIVVPVFGRRPKIRPVVLYPGWWVNKQPKDAEVWVLNTDAFEKWVANEPMVLRPQEIEVLGMALEAHIRTRP